MQSSELGEMQFISNLFVQVNSVILSQSIFCLFTILHITPVYIIIMDIGKHQENMSV